MRKMAGLVAALAASAAWANDYNGPGGVWNAGNTLVVSNIVVADNFLITDMSVSLNNLAHVWAGDLDAFIQKDAGPLIPLFVRIGGGTFGTSSDFNGTYIMKDGGASIWAAAAAAGGGAGVIAPGTYQPVTAANTASSLMAAFGGQNAAGTWTLRITDTFAGADDGSMGSWTLTLIPEPATLSLLVLGALALRRR